MNLSKISYLLNAFLLIVLTLFILEKCNPKVEDRPFDTKNNIIVLTETDTVWRDSTIHEFNTMVLPGPHEWFPVPYEDSTKLDSMKRLCEVYRTYLDTFTDSNITILSKIKTLGTLETIKLDYILHGIESINKTHYIDIKPKYEILMGTDIGGNSNTFSLSPKIEIRLPKYSISYKYDIVQKTNHIGVSVPIYRKYNKK